MAEVAAEPVDLPWQAPEVASAPNDLPASAEPEAGPAPVVSPEPASVPAVAAAPAQAPTPAVSAAPAPAPLPNEADDEDEPPPGDYDYVEVDAQGLDYDFELPASETPAAPEPLPAANPATGLAADWLELFPKLGLGGMTGSIAANCTLIEVNGDDWLLHLDPAQSALFNSTQQRRLNEALNQFHGRTLNLRIELCKPEQETPAQAAARYRAERQSNAEASIHNDPLVQQMIQQFGAVIRAESIEPLEINA